MKRQRRVLALTPNVRGRLRARHRFGTSGLERDPAPGEEHAALQTQVELLPRKISHLEGICWGRKEMIHTVLMDMYLELPNLAGGSAAAGHFRDMLQGIVKDGLP